jgi:hypothetical protein
MANAGIQLPEIAGTGGGGLSFGIGLHELVLIGELLFAAMIIVYWVHPIPNVNALQVLSQYILGYPTCSATFCFLPSQSSIANVASAFVSSAQFMGTGQVPTSLLTGNSIINAAAVLSNSVIFVLSIFDIIKGLFGLAIILTIVSQLNSFQNNHDNGYALEQLIYKSR